MSSVPKIHRCAPWLLLVGIGGSPLTAQDLPFDPPAPHPKLEQLGELEGILYACSTRLDASGSVLSTQEFRVSIARKVFGQAVSVDLLGTEGGDNLQSSFLMYDPTEEELRDVTVSAIGAVEHWDEAVPWDDEVLAFRLRGKARFVIGDDPAQPLDFRKAYLDIGDAGYELAYTISDDDGASWSRLFHSVAVSASAGGPPMCPEGGA